MSAIDVVQFFVIYHYSAQKVTLTITACSYNQLT